MKKFQLSAIAYLAVCGSSICQVSEFKIMPQVTAGIDGKLFGQFMEKPSWGGEIGGDAAFDKNTGEVIPGVLGFLREMNIPIVRFPGGTDVDYYPWYNLIDNVPSLHQQRPAYRHYSGDKKVTSDNRLGLDKFMVLCEELNTEPLLVVNIGDAFFKNISIEEAAANAAGMVAYCNYETAAQLPKGMINWVDVRKKNGHPKPYKVKYFEVGNEPWLFFDRLPNDYNRAEVIAHYMNCLEAIVDAMRAVDPDIQIITDGEIKEVVEQMKSRMGNKIQYIAFHTYRPWDIKEVKKNGEAYPIKQMTETEIWNAWVSAPVNDAVSGMSRFPLVDSYARVSQSGYPLACTEWNWNGWWQGQALEDACLNSRFAKGIGAAGFIHALMRDAGNIKIGCQSMLVGNSWDITAIYVDTISNEAKFFPTGKITGFYSKYHGDELLEMESKDLTFFNQPFELNWLKPSSKVAYVDALASRSKTKLYFHAINRDLNNDIEIKLDLSNFRIKSSYNHHKLLSSNVITDELGFFKDDKLTVDGPVAKVVLPKHSVSILEFEIY
jgi:alpha-N-arabinofuranosidase